LAQAGPRPNDRQKPEEAGLNRLGLWHRLWLARLALTWEGVWRAIWPALTLAGLFLALALSDLLPDLNGYLHIGVLAAFAVGFALLLWLGLRGLALPGAAAARRRIELVNACPTALWRPWRTSWRAAAATRPPPRSGRCIAAASPASWGGCASACPGAASPPAIPMRSAVSSSCCSP